MCSRLRANKDAVHSRLAKVIVCLRFGHSSPATVEKRVARQAANGSSSKAMHTKHATRLIFGSKIGACNDENCRSINFSRKCRPNTTGRERPAASHRQRRLSGERSQISQKWLRSSVNAWLIQALQSNRPKVPKRGRNHKVGKDDLVADMEKMSLSELAALEADVVRQVTAGPIAPQGTDANFDGDEKRMRALKREISAH
jgi:hypothetical protein